MVPSTTPLRHQAEKLGVTKRQSSGIVVTFNSFSVLVVTRKSSSQFKHLDLLKKTQKPQQPPQTNKQTAQGNNITRNFFEV